MNIDNTSIISKERNPYFDNAKAILIILVVFGHTIQPFINQNYILKIIFTFIYLFHMPAFTLLSGYFSKNIKKLSKAELRYLALYLMFTLIYYPFAKTDLLIMFIIPYFHLWYLISLISWYVLIQFFSKIKYFTISILLSFIIAIGIGYISEINTVASLSRTLVLFPFFLIGYFLKPYHFIRLKQQNIAIPIFILIISFVILYYLNINYNWVFFTMPYKYLTHIKWYSGIYRIVLFATSTILVFCFLIIIPCNYNRLTIIGKYTLTIFLGHMLILQSIFHFFN